MNVKLSLSFNEENYKYFIRAFVLEKNNNHITRDDSRIARLIDLTKEEYQSIMINNFNATVCDGKLIFPSKVDAKKAKILIEQTCKLMGRDWV